MNFRVRPVVQGNSVKVAIPTDRMTRLGRTFEWHSGTETSGDAAGVRLYQDRCPGGAGAVAPEGEWVRATR